MAAPANRAVKTTCPYCGVGCGVVARRADDGVAAVTGDAEHPANFGKLCLKGTSLAETIGLPGRLLYPMIDGKRADWDAAIARVAAGFEDVIRCHGPDAVAFYVSGQLLTEDYYVANKLMKGFIGSANIDTNSRLCMASSVAGHKRAFGSDSVPGCYEDLEQAEMVVLVGSNAAWCHPILYRRIAERRRGADAPKVVVIDPRRTATCDAADIHLALAPGTDSILFNGLLAYLHTQDAGDMDFASHHADGVEDALQAALKSSGSIAEVASRCGLAEQDVRQFFAWFAATEKTVTLYSQGVNQSTSGTDKVNAIINCHLLTGRIGRPGMGPFSLTGQPNAMGGREVGGLANQLAAHMEIGNAADRDRVQRFWTSPRIADKAGLKAVDMFQAIGDGRIKAVWIMATNPAVSLPDADSLRAAMKRCELVVVSDCMERTDSTSFAHVLLPAAAWGEKDGTVTNSERRISRQRAFLPLAGEARPDWWIISQVARRMRFGAAFDYDTPADIFREHAALSGFENDGTRDFDISGLAEIDNDAYAALPPMQWPVTRRRPSGTKRLFADGRFFTPDGRARFVAVEPRLPTHAPDAETPFVLNTGRVRDHWHTLTRSGLSARLSRHTAEPIVEINPGDAMRAEIAEGSLVRLETARGTIVARAKISRGQRPGSVFVPMHWNDQFSSRARINALIDPACDPVSGQPESKHMPVKIEAYAPRWHAVALTREPLPLGEASYWAVAKDTGCWRHEFAGEFVAEDWDGWARALLGARAGEGEWLAYRDKRASEYRCALIEDGRLAACLFVSPEPSKVSRLWLAELFTEDELSPSDRMGILAGAKPGSPGGDSPVVCSCFGICRADVIAAIEDGAASVEDISGTLRAGTSCGSCRPELGELLGERFRATQSDPRLAKASTQAELSGAVA